jgi:hypothetical protein
MNCHHCYSLIGLSQELLRRIAWVDFGGVYYMYQRGCLVFCAKAAGQSHPLIPLLEGNAGDGAANHGAGNGRFRPPQNRHGPWIPIPE